MTCELFNQAVKLARGRGLSTAISPKCPDELDCNGTTCRFIIADDGGELTEEDAAADATLQQLEGEARIERFYKKLEKTMRIISASS